MDFAVQARISSISTSATLARLQMRDPLPQNATSVEAATLVDDGEADDLIQMHNARVPPAEHLDRSTLDLGLKQERLSRPIDDQLADDFYASLNPADQARLYSQRDPLSHIWLLQRPNEEAGTAIPTLEFPIAILFWLGEIQKYGGPCAYCQTELDPLGNHATGTCRHGRHVSRHYQTVRVIKNFMGEWNIKAQTETPHIFGPADRRRPADLSLPRVRSEAIFALDASFINPTCPSYLPQTAQEGGYAAQLREDDKLEKYSALCTQHHIDFEPLALEVYGRTTARGMNTLKELVRYAVTHSNAEMPQTVINWQFHQLKARLCVTLLRQNVDMILRCCNYRSDHPDDQVDPLEHQERELDYLDA